MSRFKPLAFSILAVFAVGLCLTGLPCVQKVSNRNASGESRHLLRNTTNPAAEGIRRATCP
jgi:hypothetical protein